MEKEKKKRTKSKMLKRTDNVRAQRLTYGQWMYEYFILVVFGCCFFCGFDFMSAWIMVIIANYYLLFMLLELLFNVLKPRAWDKNSSSFYFRFAWKAVGFVFVQFIVIIVLFFFSTRVSNSIDHQLKAIIFYAFRFSFLSIHSSKRSITYGFPVCTHTIPLWNQ